MSVLAALGSPPASDWAPGRRAPAWKAARLSLERGLRGLGCLTRVRSWQALWSALWGSPPPRCVSWAQLAGDHSLDSLSESLACCSSLLPSIFYWNARWLINLHDRATQEKRSVLLGRLLRGHVVAIVETHWTAEVYAVWRSQFPAGAVLANVACQGPGGGPAGGTAFLIPPGVTVVGHTVVVPGCLSVLEARLAANNSNFSVVLVYLPPGRQGEVLTALGGLRPASDSVFVIGDLNIDLHNPRTAAEVQLADRFLSWSYAASTTSIPPAEVTRRAGTQASTIDVACLPAPTAWRFEVSVATEGGLSDHSSLTIRPAPRVSLSRRQCTPAVFKTLHADAIADLRRRFANLCAMFGVPLADPTPAANDYPRPAAPGEVPPDHPMAACMNDSDEEWIEPVAIEVPPADTCVPWLPSLASHGYRAMMVQLRAWWSAWSRYYPRDPVETDLHRAVDSGQIAYPLGRLSKDWFAATFDDAAPATITSERARELLNLWHAQQASSRHHRPRPGSTQSVRRPALHRDYATGRLLFKGRKSSPGVRDTSGVLHTDPATVDAILWQSREAIWTAAPSTSAAGVALLDAYFADGRRRARLPPRPCPLQGEIAGLVLQAKNSAAGLDGQPYEVYHVGLTFVVFLLAQAHWAADNDLVPVASILGPNEDLSVWIPKKEGADLPSGQRPLQLPSTLRRLYGSSVLMLVGPIIERQLSEHQAATRGGSCGPNIQRAYAHLGSRPRRADPRDSPLWRGVLGEAADPCLALCQQASQASLNKVPAVVLADQSKAFERLSLPWLREVMRRWQFPTWIYRAFVSLTAGRSVRRGPGATARQLRCGLGMGGPPSPFLWNLSYDPIVSGLSAAVGAPTPTYVDDLSGLVVGPGQTLQLLIFLIVAGHAAGLRTDVHECSILMAKGGRRRAVVILAHFPVDIEDAGCGDDSFVARGLPAHFVYAILRQALGPVWAAGVAVNARPCGCSIKTAIVPAARVADWAVAIGLAPYGPGACVARAPYLGVSLGGRTSFLQDGSPTWQINAWEAIQLATWKSAISKVLAECGAIVGAASAGLRSSYWRTYMSPKLLYPAALSSPGPGQMEQLRGVARRLFPAPWAKWWAPFGLGPLFGVKGAPRHPDVVIRAAAACSWAREGSWAPDGAPQFGADCWRRGRRWANDRPSDDPLAPCREAFREADRVVAAGRGRDAVTGQGGVIYASLWHEHDAGRWRRWANDRSAERRWWPTNGHEWDLLRHAPNFTAGFQVLRLFCGGVHDGQGVRTGGERDAHPRICRVCGAPATVAWVTPSPVNTGVAWCTACAPPATSVGAGWAAAAELLTEGDVPLRCLADRARIEAGWGSSLSPLITLPRAARPCPLCNLGEHSSEHLLVWCPAVFRAWRELGGAGRGLIDALATPSLHSALLATLLHQVVFLAGSLSDQGQMDWIPASNALVRAVRHHDGQPGDLAGPEPPVGHCDRAWSAGKPPCALCFGSFPARRRVGASAKPKHRRIAWSVLESQRIWPVSSSAVRAGAVLAGLHGSEARGLWPHRGAGWWPRPGRAPGAVANAKWDLQRCPRCGYFCLILSASRDIPAGHGIVVPAEGLNPILGPADEDSFEVVFDGATTQMSDDPDEPRPRRVAAGAACLRGPARADGTRPIIATASVALPGVGSSEAAEAWAGALGLGLLADYLGPGRAVAGGDNPNVIRFCAGTGSLASPEARGILDGPLSRVSSMTQRITWVLIPRAYNLDAHAEARAAVARARDLALAGESRAVFWRNIHS